MLFEKKKINKGKRHDGTAATPDQALLQKQVRAAKCLNWITSIGLVSILVAYINSAHDNRAWVSVSPLPGHAIFVAPNLIIKIKVANTGKDPAIDANFSDPEINFVSIDKETGQPEWHDADICKGLHAKKHGRVIFPGQLGEREVQLPIQANPYIHDDLQGLLDGTRGLLIAGCIAYKSFLFTHHTQYCIFERTLPDGTRQPTDCVRGQYAD